MANQHDKGGKNMQWGKYSLSVNGVEKLYSSMQENETGSLFHPCTKNQVKMDIESKS